MAGKYLVIIVAGLLLSSCAQVGVITGGDKDSFAPKPIAEKVSPPNESTNFSANTVEIPFDEYFRLVNPVQNIRMIPPHATVDAQVKGKSLLLSWEDTLEANTTYAIYLTNAVSDLTEGNDTIMQYVFSTGAVLDTLSYSVGVTDAQTGEPIDDCVVALYQPMSNKLVSFAEPNKGVATMKYLRPGEYRAVAFVDENNDLKLQEFEKIGFPEGGKVKIDTSFFDSIPLRMYLPEALPKIESVEQLSNCLLELELSENFGPIRELYANGTKIPEEKIGAHSITNCHFPYDPSDASSVEIVATGFESTDTTNLRIKNIEDISVKLLDGFPAAFGDNGTGSMMALSTNIWLTPETIKDSSLIYLVSKEDSSRIELNSLTSNGRDLHLFFDLEQAGEYSLVLEEGALNNECTSPSKKEEIDVTFFEDKDFGIINVDVSQYESAVRLELMLRGKVHQTKNINAGNLEEPVVFKQLFPGEYSFKVIRDENGNGQWDVGKYSELVQPEQVDIYSKKTKVRANWSIDVTLTPTY